MTFQLRRTLSLGIGLAFLLSLAVALAAPAVAHADALSWSRTYVGPDDVSVGDIDYPIATSLNAVSFADAAHGWAVGVHVYNVSSSGGTRSAFIAFSDDGGASWTPKNDIGVTRELHGVLARSATDVWAVGDDGTLLNYNGFSWAAKTISGWPATKDLRAIAFSGSTGWAVGEGYGVARTTDGGVTWSTWVAPGTSGWLRAVSAAGAGAYAVGDTGTGTGSAVMKYLDSAGSWSRSPGTGSALFGIAFADSANGWAVGANRTFVRTSNGGATWSAPAVTPPLLPGTVAANNGLRAIAFADAANGMVVGKYQGVWRTTDGGEHWEVAAVSDPGTLGDYELRGVGFAAGDADAPVTVGRAYVEKLTSGDQKARVYRGAWSRPDETAPTTASDAQVAYLSQATVHLTASDGLWGSGVAHTYYRLDGAPQVEGVTVQTSVAGAHTLEFWSVDAVGNTETPHQTVDFTITMPDVAAPVTTADVSSPYSGSATIQLAAADNVGGSGVAHTFYRLDGAPQVEGVTVQTSVAGAHSLEFWSADVAGNTETPHKTADFTVTTPDTIAPTTSSDAVTGYTDSATIGLTATDNAGGTGVAHTYYRLDGVGGVEGASVTVNTPGAHTLEFWSVDTAGNEELPHKTAAFSVAITPPADTVAPVTSSDAAAAYIDSATIRLTAADLGSGVAHTYYRLDGGAQTEGVTIRTAVAGAHDIEFWSVDVAGNPETPHKTKHFTVTIPDRIAPVTASDVLAVYSVVATITLAPTDNAGGSGVAHTYFRLDGGAQTEGTSIPVAGAGQHSLEYWSTDAAGNTETHKTANFVLTLPRDDAAPVTISDARSSYTGSATIKLTATDVGSGVVHIYYRIDGAAPVENAPSPVTLAVGKPGAHTVEYWSVDAADNEESPHTTVAFTVLLPAATVYAPHAPTSMRRSRYYTIYGYLKPRHTSGTYAITLRFYRYRSGSYVYYKSVRVKVSNYYSYSKYSGRVSLPYTGRWRVLAVHSDSGHRSSSSAYDYIRVY